MPKSTVKTQSALIRFTVQTVGPPPSPEQLRDLMEEARQEALQELKKPQVQASVKPDGGLFGAGLEIVYLLHVSWPYIHAAGALVATGAATEAGKQLFQYLAKALRKRDILPSEPKSVGADKDKKAKNNKKKKGAKAPHKK
jgi:hypothetical protein